MNSKNESRLRNAAERAKRKEADINAKWETMGVNKSLLGKIVFFGVCWAIFYGVIS